MFEEHNIWAEMSKSPVKFHLTGSRFFGWGKKESDWDFFVGHNPEIDERLKQMGFTKELNAGYDDPVSTSVWTHRDGVHVQVVDNIFIKAEAQEFIRSQQLIDGNMSKTNQKLVWRAVITALISRKLV